MVNHGKLDHKFRASGWELFSTTCFRAKTRFRNVKDGMPPACPVVCDAGSYPKRPPFLFSITDCPAAAFGSGWAIEWEGRVWPADFLLPA